MTADLFSRSPWSEMRNQASALADSITADRPAFSLDVKWPGSYQELLAGAEAETTEENILLEQTLQTGRVLLSSEAGSGKTWLLARMMNLTLQSRDAIPILIQLKNLSAAEPLSTDDGTESLMRHLFSIATPNPRVALTTSGSVPNLVLMVDGLNEVPRGQAEPVIGAVDELARRYPFLSVLVTDRLVRRPLDLDRWRLATVLPLSDEEVRRAWSDAHESQPLPTDLALLRRPFFLDTALATDTTHDTEAATIEAYFSQVVGVRSNDLDRLADAAFDAYARYGGRTVPATWLRDQLSDTALQRLLGTGAVRQSGDQAWFTHHLLHDYLASRSLVRRRADWEAEGFDTVTLTAASFDSLRLAVEQLQSTADADAFIRSVYDWNYYGAAYALLPNFVSDEMRAVILAMLADKKWDPIWATAVAVTDSLRVDGSDVARQLLEAEDRDDLFATVRAVTSSEGWFTEWVALFTLPDETTADSKMVIDLRAEDSIVSWTLANVLRRVNFHKSAMAELLRLASDNSAVVRWRAVHVLGAHPSDQSADVLIDRLRDGDRWVRYGAVRSFVEIASRTQDAQLRDTVFSTFRQLLHAGLVDDTMQRELARALDVRPQPAGWAQEVTPLIQQLVGLAETLVDQDRWGRVMEAVVKESGN
jgi:HEAT repeats